MTREEVLRQIRFLCLHEEAVRRILLLPGPPTPVTHALLNYHHNLPDLPRWELEEIEMVYRALSAVLAQYRGSRVLAITRISLEIGLVKGQ